MSKKAPSDLSLFSQYQHALQKADEICPDCGAQLQHKQSKKGTFLGCSNYPACQYTRPIHEQERIEQQVLPGSVCPACGALLAVKQGRYGLFIGCTNYPACHHIEEDKPKTVEVPCPQCHQGLLQERTNRFGKTFYSCEHYPRCKYIVNYQPVAKTCPECAWPILVKRIMAQGEILICPEKKCSYKTKSV